MLAQSVWAEPVVEAGSHCAFDNQPRDWGNSNLGSAYTGIDTVVDFCEPCGHLAVFNMRTFKVSYFVAYIRDSAFAINVIPFSETGSAVNCVYASEKLDRFETCAHLSAPSANDARAACVGASVHPGRQHNGSHSELLTLQGRSCQRDRQPSGR